MNKIAVITGADGGMGSEITREVAAAGYKTIMLCQTKEKGEERKRQIIEKTGNNDIEVKQIDLSSMSSISKLCDELLKELPSIDLLMNNAGTMCTHFKQTEEGFEYTVAVNYLAPFLLSNKLVPLMHKGSRIVNMVSCTYKIGKVGEKFFTHGRDSKSFWRIPIYSNTKYALWMFTYELSQRLKDRGISVNAADPGIVSTNIIRMDMWFDVLTDIIYRPLIRTPRQGADTAIHLLLDKCYEDTTGEMFASNKQKTLKSCFKNRDISSKLWSKTEKMLSKFLK